MLPGERRWRFRCADRRRRVQSAHRPRPGCGRTGCPHARRLATPRLRPASRSVGPVLHALGHVDLQSLLHHPQATPAARRTGPCVPQSPAPRQAGQVVEIMRKPCACTTWPRPRHCAQASREVPGAAPDPSQSWQAAHRCTFASFPSDIHGVIEFINRLQNEAICSVAIATGCFDLSAKFKLACCGIALGLIYQL